MRGPFARGVDAVRYMVKTTELYDLSASLAGEYLQRTEYPFEALAHIGEWIARIGENLPHEAFWRAGDEVWISESASVAPTAQIIGPAIVGPSCEIRHGAYLRGNVLLGKGCVVGNSSELKNCILFDGVQLPHFNYAGDSVLGRGVHFGAGAIASNLRADRQNVCLHVSGANIPTERRKVGAMVGDGAEIGCGAVLSPGAVVGPRAIVYPLKLVRGCVPSDAILKSDDSIIKRV